MKSRRRSPSTPAPSSRLVVRVASCSAPAFATWASRSRSQDSEEADPLPTRFQVGMLYRYPFPERYATDAELNMTADLTDGLNIDRPLPRVGAEFVWQKRAFLRGGYVFDSAESDAGGPTLGLGFSRNNLVLDLARVFSGFSADAGQAPTFLSLRFSF